MRVKVSPEFTTETARAAFEASYRARYGRVHPELALDIVALRLSAVSPTPRPQLEQMPHLSIGNANTSPLVTRDVFFAGPARRISTPIYNREDLPVGYTLTGPAVIEEYTSTTVLCPGDQLIVGGLGELQITCEPKTFLE